jgi:hypothetical protein
MAVAASALRTKIEQDGYAVVPNVVPQKLLDAVVADIWQHTGADPNDRESWYKPGIVAPTGMVEMYQYQSMWDTRQYPRVHEVFSDIFGSPKLWVSLDRVNLKPPADPLHPEHDHKGFIHWDTDTSKYPDIPFRVQGVLALADTEASQGGFQCVPALYRELGAWIARQPADRPPRKPDLTGYQIEQIALKAGDMVIWSTLMPHGNGHNVSDRPRLAQYISMSPARDDEAARESRVRAWQERIPPPGTAFPGDPRKIEQQAGSPANLTPLGRKLLGADPWE